MSGVLPAAASSMRPSTDAGSAADAAGTDLSNWRLPPYNRWAFHHVEQLLPCASIAADPAGAAPWPLEPVDFSDFRLKLPGGSTLDLPQYLAQTCSDALVVVRHGRVVFENYANGLGADSSHILMSATKSIIGLLCGVLVDRGLLDLDAAVSDVLPELASTIYGRATPRDLLDMQVAPGFGPQALAAYAAASGWDPAPPGQEAIGLHDFFAALPAAPPSASHRGPFAYVSANTDLLGWVIERCTGRTVAALLSECLWLPMGGARPAAITLDRRGAPRCTGGICATARDFARIGQLVADGGVANGRRVLPAAWIDDIVDNGDSDAWARGEFAASFGPRQMHYRSGWYVIDAAPTTLFAMGIHGQHLFIDRARGLVVAQLSSQPQPIEASMTALTHRAIAEIRRLLGVSSAPSTGARPSPMADPSLADLPTD